MRPGAPTFVLVYDCGSVQTGAKSVAGTFQAVAGRYLRGRLGLHQRPPGSRMNPSTAE